MLGSIFCAAILAANTPSDLAGPVSMAGAARGADAVGVDPASVGFANDFELQLRLSTQSHQTTVADFGSYIVVPLEPLFLSAGYGWQWTHQRFEQVTAGLAIRPIPELSLGFAYNNLIPRGVGDRHANLWDLGLYFNPSSWLSGSMSVNALGSRHFMGRSLPALARFGVAIRPLAATPYLTLAADTEWQWHRGDFYHTRLLVDIAVDGLHGFAGWGLQDETLWLGLSFALGSVNARAVGEVARPGGSNYFFPQTHASLTYFSAPTESLYREQEKTIEVPLYGQLETVSTSFLSLGLSVSDMLPRLEKLAWDPGVKTVVLSIGELDVGLATVDELCRAVERLKEHGKEVVAEIATADEKTYMVASAASRIRMDTVATLRLDGFAVETQYFADTFNKVGVRFESVAIGRYKSAPNVLTHNQPQPEELEVREAIVQQAYTYLTAALEKNRRFSKEKVAQVINAGAFSASEALQIGLVDELSQPRDPKEPPHVREPGQSVWSLDTPSREWGKPPSIAIVPVNGTIVGRRGDNPLPGDDVLASEVIEQLERWRSEVDVRAVVLRIDSPGGDVFAADLIWRAVRRVADVKPVVVSMGDVAASGGYYVAAPGHVIFADPNTITGSIGIFWLKADLSGLYEKLGVHTQVTKRGEHADWASTSKPLSDDEKEKIRQRLQHYYEDFVAKVAVGRHLSIERVKEIAEGRVYTGKQALALGLIDKMGGLTDAIAEAKSRAGLAADKPVQLLIPEKTITLRGLLDAASYVAAPQKPLETVLSIQNFGWNDKPLALLPVSYRILP